MKQIFFTMLLCVFAKLLSAGIMMINWPYMDNTDNCILVFNDPDNNNVWDIHLTVNLRSFSSYSDNPTLFDQNSNELGIAVTTTADFIFIPLSQFQVSFQQGRFLPLYTYSKNIAISYEYMFFEYEVKVAYRSPNGGILNFSNPNILFLEWRNSMTPQGSVSEQAVKDICPIELVPFDPPPLPFDPDPPTVPNEVIDFGKFSNPDIIGKNLKGQKDDLIFRNTQKTNHFNFIGFAKPKEFTINYAVTYPQVIFITIFSLEGKVMYSYKRHLDEGFHKKTFSTISFPKGLYFCQFQSENNIETIKLMKTQ